MPTATIVRRFSAPADAVWQYVRWHGVAKLEQYSGAMFARIDFDGDIEQPGIIKTVYPHEGHPIVERLDEVNAADRTYRYRLLDVGSMPITDYTGYVRVTPAGPDACHLKIECNFTPVDVTEQEWREIWFGIETELMNEIAPLIEPAGAPAQTPRVS